MGIRFTYFIPIRRLQESTFGIEGNHTPGRIVKNRDLLGILTGMRRFEKNRQRITPTRSKRLRRMLDRDAGAMTDCLVHDERRMADILIGKTIDIGGILRIQSISKINTLRIKTYLRRLYHRVNRLL